MSENAESTTTNRNAGILIPVFSIRKDSDLGIGDVAGLRSLINWAAETGVEFLQLLPINETGTDNSPYNAISSVALEPLTLDCSPNGLPELTQEVYEDVLGKYDIRHLRIGPVKYEQVRILKLDLLWRAFSVFESEHFQRGTSQDDAFHLFCDLEAKWLGDYCLYRLLMDMEEGQQSWPEWNSNYDSIAKARDFVDKLLDVEPVKTERQLVYYAYIQWIAFTQWRGVSAYAKDNGVRLMGDIPFGVSLNSADVFANPEIFDLNWYGGAPPETLFKDDEFVQKWGQNWGIPLYRWDVLKERDYDWWRQRVGKTVDIFSMFRVDHALGFYRIYSFPWNPVRNSEFLPLSEDEAAERCDGKRPCFKPRSDDNHDDAMANKEQGKVYLKMLQEAAGEAEVIAEDLGMVPDYVRPSLAYLNIAGMKVPQWEHSDGGVTPGSDYPHVSFAAYATHDHAPLKAQWNEQRQLLANAEFESHEWWEAHGVLKSLSQFAGIEFDAAHVPEYSDEIRESLLRALFESSSRDVAVMISDLLGFEERINVPGIMDGVNWAWRLDMTVDELRKNPHWAYLNRRMKKMLQESGRAS